MSSVLPIAAAFACAVLLGLAADRSSGGTFPGASGKIAYVLSLDGNQIHVTNPDGTGDALLTTQGLNSSPAWSPNGDRIAFQSTRDGNDEIYTMNADGSFQTNVTRSAGSDIEPDFSPDGTKLCFSRAIDGYDIFVINVDGTGLTQLTQFGPEERRCSWSPDGTKVAYAQIGSQSGIWTVDVAAPHAQKQLSDGLGADDRPSWSPDGSKVLFDSTRAGVTRIWEMNADGSSPAPVTSGPGDIAGSRSPDGGRLVFTRADATGSPQVFRAASDGSGATQVTGTAGAKLDPQWQPLGGSPPAASGVPTITGTPRVGATLTAHTAGWTGADTTAFQWLRCLASCSPIDAATGSTLRLGRQLVGAQIAVRETGTNAAGSTTVTSALTAAVPALAGDGQIFFLRSATLSDPNQDLWSAAPDGSTLTPYITDSDSVEQYVAISPEGARAVYGRKPLGQPDSAFELYLDGPGFNRPLTSNNFLDTQPAWSPDGKTIAFVSDRGGPIGIFLLNVQTLAVTTLYQGAFPSQTPSFSPDGKQVTFFTCGPGNCRVNVINVDGTGLTTITDGQFNDTDPDWGPEGKIVFVRDLDGFTHQLVVVNPDGSGAQAIVDNGAYNADPSWSPNGDRVAFVTTAFGRSDFDLATVGAEGGPLARVTQDLRNGFPDWAPLLRFAAPAANSTVSGEISVRIFDLNVPSARFSYVTAGGATTDLGTDTDPPFSVTFDTTTVPEGPGRIVVDTAGPLENSLPVTVDNAPPDTTITAGPSGSTSSTIADFRFSSSEPDSTFFCALDGAGLDNCPAPASAFYQGLAVGQHTFQVAAIDSAGNQDGTPAERSWTVTAPPPPSTDGSTAIASLTDAGALGDGHSAFPSISDDGRVVGFESLAGNLTPVGSARNLQVYARDRTAGTTALISTGRPQAVSVPGNANSGYAQVSDDGTAVAFQSLANNLDCIPTCLPDTNHWHVYVSTPGPDVRTLVRVDKPDGGVPNGDAQHPAVNGDGSIVAFESLATNLGPLDTNQFSDIYVRNANSVFERISVATVTGTEADGPSFSPAVTPDGRYVAFVSNASNLVPNDVNGLGDVFVRDRQTGTTTLVSVGPGGVQSDGESSDGVPPSISADGRYVAFSSIATNLAPGTVDDTEHVYVRDLVAGTTEVVDVSATGERANAQSTAPSISDDGRYVTFDSAASNLSPLTPDGGQNVFRHDRQTGALEVANLNPAGQSSSGSHNGQFGTALSANGRYAAFYSFASDLLGPGKDSNESLDVFVRDFSPPAVPETVTADLVAGAPTVEAGAADVAIADLPLSLALQPSTTSSSPIAQQPVAQQPVAQQPIAQQPIAQQPIAQQPIAQFGLTVSDVAAALGDVSLASIPTTYPGGWPAVQAGTRFEGFPAQSVTLGQLITSFPKTCNPAVLGSCKAPPPLDGVTTTPRQLVLADLDLSQSRLRNLPLLAFAYGGTLLSQLDPGAATGTDQPALTDWCVAFAGPPLNCTNPTSLSGQTVMGAALQGAPVAQQPIAQQPIAQQPIAQQPIAQMPIAQMPIAQFSTSASPIAQQPIAQQDLAASHMDTLSLREILAAHSRLGSIQITALANKAAIVSGGSGTLADAFAASPANIVSTATLGTLAANTSLAGFTLGDIAFYGDLKVIDLVNGLPQPNSYTVADLIAIMVSRAALEWESIPAERLAAFGKNPDGLMTWHAGFTLGGSGVGATDVRLTLPSGFRYVAGSAKLVHGTTTTQLGDPASNGDALTFTVPNVVFGTAYTIDLDTYAGFVLGPTQAKLAVLPALGSLTGADTASVIVTDTFESNDTPAGAAPVSPNTNLQLSYVAQAGDVDYFSVDTQPGDRLSVHLANVSADFDLSIIAPAQTKLRTTGAAGPPQQNASIRDDGIDTTNVNDSLEPAPLQDTPVAQQPVAQQPVAQQSVNRGANDEDGAVIAKGGKYLIKIAGYGDAASPTPYALRVTETPPQVDAVCTPRSLPALAPSERGTLPVGIPTNTNTVFLVDRYRLAQTYSPADAASVMTALGGLAGQAALGVRGVVEPVEAWPGVQALYDAWDQNPCSASRANAVSTALAGIVDSVRQSAPGLKYVVLVGGYDLLPPFVIPDLTRIANETGYASTFANNQYWGWLATSNILSDEPYYDTDPVDLRDTQFFLGDLVGGRLVETPAQIVSAATRFSNPTVNGTLNRSTALSTGYDFVKDGAQAVADAAKTYLPATSVRTLINDGFAANDLVSALLPATGAASLNSLNGHFDHYRALSAAGSANGTLDVMSTANIDAQSGALAGDVLFSVGCHAGLPVSDVIVGTTTPSRDWAQALASQGSVWAANTGFGLGDTDTVAFSERLMALFAGNLNGSLSIGEALTRAKQQYYLDRPALSAYDEKSLLEASLFGLPFYNVGVPTAAPPAPTTVPGTTAATTPAASPIAKDPVSGVDSALFSATPDFGTVITGKHGKFYANAGGVDVVNYRPIVPKLTMPATKPGLRAHSPFIETLQSVDEANFDGDFVTPTEDLTALSPEAVFGDAAFPSTLATVVSAKIGNSIQSQLDLGTGQFSTDEALDNSGVGLMRRFTRITGRVFYGTTGTFAPPTIRSTSATKFGSNVGFVVNVCDSVRTYVLFHDLGAPNAPWTGVNLVQDPGAGSCRWSGGGTFIGPEVEYFVQACTGAGDCAQSSNKAKNYDAENAPLASDPEPGQGRITIDLSGPASPPAGFFTGPVTVDATDSVSGVALTATIDGVARSLPAQVTTDGLHLVTVTAADGGSASRAFLIDATRPRIVLTTPADGAVYNLNSVVNADYTCLDAGSGVKSCVGTVANGARIPTSQLGDNTFTVTATDNVGNQTTVTRHYTVAWPFTGFLFPVKNPPVVNIVKAGYYVPLRFSLGGNRSLSIFATGFPKSTQIPCPNMSAATTNNDDEIGYPPLPSVLVYIGFIDQYIYFWKTERSWAGTCRDFNMKLKDGTEHHALFKLF